MKKIRCGVDKLSKLCYYIGIMEKKSRDYENPRTISCSAFPTLEYIVSKDHCGGEQNMDYLFHIEPTLQHEQQAKEFVSEFRIYNSKMFGTGGLEDYTENYADWLKKIDSNRKRPITHNKVPSYTFFLVRQNDGRIVGMINIRPFLNESLLYVGGSIGYCIRPTERKKGYNKYNLMLGIKFCADLGVETIYIDCDATNVASARSAKAVGGKLVKKFYDNSSFNCYVEKYMIYVPDAAKRFCNL